MRFLSVSLVLMLNSSVFATSFSFGESIDVQNERELIDLVIGHKEFCTEKMEHGKIYLNPNMIVPSKKGVFLKIEPCASELFLLVQLPSIHSDQDGCYIMFGG